SGMASSAETAPSAAQSMTIICVRKGFRYPRSRHSAPTGRTLAEARVTSKGVTEGISREVNRAAGALSPDFFLRAGLSAGFNSGTLAHPGGAGVTGRERNREAQPHQSP